MKNNMFIRLLALLLVIASAFYIAYRKDNDCVTASAGMSATADTRNLTFSDLAQGLYKETR